MNGRWEVTEVSPQTRKFRLTDADHPKPETVCLCIHPIAKHKNKKAGCELCGCKKVTRIP